MPRHEWVTWTEQGNVHGVDVSVPKFNVYPFILVTTNINDQILLKKKKTFDDVSALNVLFILDWCVFHRTVRSSSPYLGLGYKA